MKKGFTLVELLAVIVILAIILVITVPAVNDIMRSSRENTFRVSMESLIKVIKTDYQGNGRIDSVNYKIENNSITCTNCEEGEINIKFSGDLKNASGNVTVNNDIITMNISNGLYKATYEQKEDPDKGLISKVAVKKIK